MTRSIADINAELTRLQEERKSIMAKEFEAATASFFERFPQVKCIAWTQYTPYFNDGDACTFSVGDVYFSPSECNDTYRPYDLDDDHDNPEDNVFGWYSFSEDARVSPEMKKEMQAFSDLISSHEDLLEDIYGDHAAVFLRASGAEVHEYSHD